MTSTNRREPWQLSLVVLLLLLAQWQAGRLRAVSDDDFAQLYMGGLMFRLGMFHAMYPQARPGQERVNIGYADASIAHEDYLREGKARGVPDANRFIHSPVVAMLVSPLTWLTYAPARTFWQLLMVICAWRVTMTAGRWWSWINTHQASSWHRSSFWLVLALAVSPLFYRTFRTSQISPLVAWLLVVAMQAMLTERGRVMSASVAIVIGAFAKYASLSFAPLALAKRKYTLILLTLSLLLALPALSIWLTGYALMHDYVTRIMSTFHRADDWVGNQSLEAMLMRWTDSSLPELVMTVLRIVLLAGASGLVIWKLRPHSSPVQLLAGGGALISVFMLCSPICWEHYFVYLFPWWAWLCWEAAHATGIMGWLKRSLIGVILLSMWLPWMVVQGGRLPLGEPLQSHMGLALLGVFTLACVRVWQTKLPTHETKP